jgi:hypothetical protein
MTKQLHRWLLCLFFLVLALFAGAKARGEVFNNDSLSRNGGEMRGTIKRVFAPGEEASIVQLFSYSADLLAANVITNETLRVLRIWSDQGKPRCDLRPQGSLKPTVRVSAFRIEMPVMVLVPQAVTPDPVVGGMYVSTSGAIYICGSLLLGWQLMP